MVVNVIINKGGDEEVGVIISRLHSQHEWDAHTPASFLEPVRQQLLMQKLVFVTLHLRKMDKLDVNHDMIIPFSIIGHQLI